MDKVKFVLFTAPRTGSTMLTAALLTIPEAICLPAIFAEKGWSEVPSGKYGPVRMKLATSWDILDNRLDDPATLISDICNAADHYRFIGWKHHIVKEPKINRMLLRDPSLKKILLQRENLLACYASNKIALLAREKFDEGEEKTKKCAFIPDEFTRYIMKRQSRYNDFRQVAKDAGSSLYEIEYTDAMRPGGLQPLIDFIGFPPGTTYTTNTVKRGASNILARFTNPGSVESYLTAANKEHWQHEG